MSTKKSYFEELERSLGRLSLGSMLKAWREAEGTSQTAFSKKLGLSVQNLNDIEKGRRIPSPSRAAKIAKKLDLPEEALIKLALRDVLHKDGYKFDVILKKGA